MQAEWPKRTSSCAADRLVSKVIGEQYAGGACARTAERLATRVYKFEGRHSALVQRKVEPCPLPAKCEFAGKFAKTQ
jgi:hypothetical protein